MRIPFANRTADVELSAAPRQQKVTVKSIIDDFRSQLPSNFEALFEAFVLLSPKKVRVTCRNSRALEQVSHLGLSFRNTPVVFRPCRSAKWVNITRLSYGIPEQAIIDALTPYGKVLTVKMDTYQGVYIGVRNVLIEITTPIPSSIRVADHWCNAFYPGQTPTCFACRKMGHTRANCPEAHVPPAPAEDNMNDAAVDANDHVDGGANEAVAPEAPVVQATYASVVHNPSQASEAIDQVVDDDLPPPTDIPADQDRAAAAVVNDGPDPVLDLLEQAEVTAEAENVDRLREAVAAESEVKDALPEIECGKEARDVGTDRTERLQSTHNALADVAKVEGDHRSPRHDGDTDAAELVEDDPEKHDNNDAEVSDDDDESHEDEDKDNDDEDDTEAFEDAQDEDAHLGAEWFSRKRDRPEDSSSDSSESSISHHQKKGKVLQAALTSMQPPLDPYNLKLPESPELITDDPQDPESDDDTSSPLLDTGSTDYPLTQPTPIRKVQAVSQQSTSSLDVFLSKKATRPRPVFGTGRVTRSQAASQPRGNSSV